jgi:beta-galactosidase/beta-glucuronidase
VNIITSIPRPEYPRPDFERQEWLNLNGDWKFDFDDDNIGEEQGWFRGRDFSKSILVPFCYQSELSGIDNKEMHENLWYKKEFELSENFIGKKVLLNFGAVDYIAKVWVNGEFVGQHKGGYVSFKLDISQNIKSGKNLLIVKAEDKYECTQPRGKQYWKEKPDRCWYTPTSGIWQTVWLEATGELYVDKFRMTPDIDRKIVFTEIYLNKSTMNAELTIIVSYKGVEKKKIIIGIKERISKVTIDMQEEDYIDEVHYWKPEMPNLYDVQFVIKDNGILVDEFKSYFGMRKISIKGDSILLNNSPYYQKLILDQGYWPQSLLTPPSDEAIIYDIEMTKKMGFNGARKHQKIEDPRYYYWADKLGLLVWGEMPSPYDFSVEEIQDVTEEMIGFINRDYNHPCIITWVPLNESWGVRNIYVDKTQQDFARALYYIIKAMDGTRLISTNDGWEQVESDICGIHDYEAHSEGFNIKYQNEEKLLANSVSSVNDWRLLYAEGVQYEGQPILVTEYGGIAFENKNGENWGYNGAVKDENNFFDRYADITGALRNTTFIRGYCYTQLTDVMQEVNGLMTADRHLKVDIDRIRKINS